MVTVSIVQADHPATGSTWGRLRALVMTWAASALLPLPVLAATDPENCAFISCVYLGLSCAWLVTEIDGCFGSLHSQGATRAAMLPTFAAVATNVGLFIIFGIAAGVRTDFPFPLMAALSAMPAVGMVPWLLRRTRQRYAAIMLAGVLVLAAKLVACMIARIVYGPDYVERGYTSADWLSAKLMISTFWILVTSLSLILLLIEYRRKDATTDR